MWCLLFLVAGVVIGGTVVGLSVHITKMPITSTAIKPTTLTTTSLTSTTANVPAVKDHVLMLSTYKTSDVPMVIGLDGESFLQFDCFNCFVLTYFYCQQLLPSIILR